MTADDRQAMTVRLPQELHRRLRIWAIEHGTSAAALVEQFVTEGLAREQRKEERRG